MFAHNLDDPLEDDKAILQSKVSCKVKDGYSGLGEVPGVLVDKVKRTKILKDLGVEPQKITYQTLFKDEEGKVEPEVALEKPKLENPVKPKSSIPDVTST